MERHTRLSHNCLMPRPTASIPAICCGVVLTIAATAGSGQAPGQVPGPGPGQGRPSVPAPTPESIARAEQVLVEARKALGGDKRAAVKTLVASGRTKRVRGDNLVPIEFEIFIEPPDKY